MPILTDSIQQIVNDTFSYIPVDNDSFLLDPIEWGGAIEGSSLSALSSTLNVSRNPFDTNRKNTVKIPNPLRDYETYNYIITMGALTANEYTGNGYIQNGFRKIIFRSGGGEYNRRVQTSLELGDTNSKIPEQDFNDHAEYFIEDLEVDAVIAPNQNTRLALGTNVRFKVLEPYSMGKFIEALTIAASESNFTNYTHAPYCLRIDFSGWSFTGAQRIPPSYIPIQITKLDFEVTSQGSTYDVEAVVYNDSSFFDTTNKIKTEINVSGSTVFDVLGDHHSLAQSLNGLTDDQETDGRIIGYDKYVIMFPTSLSDATDAVSNVQQEPGITVGVNDQDTSTTRVNGSGTRYDSLLKYAYSSGNVNEIGQSKLILENGQVTTPIIQTPANTGVVFNRASNAQDPTVRQFQFYQDTRITDAIESVLLASEYAKQFSSEKSQNGFKKFYRIISKVILDDLAPIQSSIGRPRKVFVYMVVPYTVSDHKTLAPGQNPNNIDVIKNLAKKEYNYFYTGKNEDVLDFKINFNTSYFNIIYGDLGVSPALPNHSSTGTDRLETVTADSKTDNDGNSDTPSTETGDIKRESYTRMSPGTGHLEKIAAMVHDRIINSPADMITGEIDIWGDPYFIPSDLGNYNPSISEYALSSRNTMSYVNNEIYVIINFITPFDYQVDGHRMDFPGEYTRFSGVYQVWGVTNTFSNGEFKQNLKLIRIKQDGEGTDNDSASIKESGKYFGATPLARATFNTNGTIDGIGQQARPGSRSTTVTTSTTQVRNTPVTNSTVATVAASFEDQADSDYIDRRIGSPREGR